MPLVVIAIIDQAVANNIILRFMYWKYHFSSSQSVYYRGADKSLARPGRKQVTATEDFDVHIFYLLS